MTWDPFRGLVLNRTRFVQGHSQTQQPMKPVCLRPSLPNKQEKQDARCAFSPQSVVVNLEALAGNYQEQMARHHYLGALPKIGETVWYVATWREEWVAQVSMSAAALKCTVRDRWTGWESNPFKTTHRGESKPCQSR